MTIQKFVGALFCVLDPFETVARKKLLRSEAFASALQSLTEVESYKKVYAEFTSAADDCHKKSQQLDSKVKRWQDVPEEILSMVESLRQETNTYHACASAFRLSGKKGLKENSYHIEVVFFMIEVQIRGRPTESWPDYQSFQ